PKRELRRTSHRWCGGARLPGNARRQAVWQAQSAELVAVEGGDLSDPAAGDAQDVDGQRQVAAFLFLELVEGERGLPVHGGLDDAQALQIREAEIGRAHV